jgi:hypothetical protein
MSRHRTIHDDPRHRSHCDEGARILSSHEADAASACQSLGEVFLHVTHNGLD